MRDYKPITVLPIEFQREWRARVTPADQAGEGAFRLVGIERTEPGSSQEGRILVSVIDEDGKPVGGVKVAFAFSTAPSHLFVTDEFQWFPRAHVHKAFFANTDGGGQTDHIQGSPVKDNEPGGVTVFIFEPKYASDIVEGCGMLADHTGLHLTFQLRREGVRPLAEVLADLEERLKAAETRIKTLEGAVFSPPAESSVFDE